MRAQIQFDNRGIGDLLARGQLHVPLNQREYSWEAEHVADLFTDLEKARSKRFYFLGTIVLTGGSQGEPEVSDGQQRLATTTILLAAIRDYFVRSGDTGRANAVRDEFLCTTDLRTKELVPRLRLNVDDDTFFRHRVLSEPGDAERAVLPTKDSHKRIASAARLAADHVRGIVSGEAGERSALRLVDWVEFIRANVEVVVLRVPSHLDAFAIFETLNDRGLRISQADLLKNHLLSLADDRILEAQQTWARMVGSLESLDREDIAVTYLHHFLIGRHGPTKASQVFAKVQETVNTKQQALGFVGELAEGATDYVALFNSDHPKWSAYGTSMRDHVATINRDLRVDQVRPLMFAVARHFAPAEAEKAFRQFVSWSVRFLVVGGRGGLLDRNYAQSAQSVGSGKVATAAALAKAMADIIPSDAMFQTSFAEARVSLVHLARYYLRALEQTASGDPEPEFMPSDDTRFVTLEHVLPQRPDPAAWSDIDAETAGAYYKRIGNLALLQCQGNNDIGNRSFADKKAVLAASAFRLTADVAAYTAWGVTEVEDRQRKLADLAVKTWPIKIPTKTPRVRGKPKPPAP